MQTEEAGNLLACRSGAGGGTVVGVGTPEELAANPASHTGRYLAPYLRKP